ncbi:MAG TPA: precorrin-6A reductase [Oscillospiraceae bacterium]|nr:precorrin-6A reductase [Oscillospiraceae bacterium]
MILLMGGTRDARRMVAIIREALPATKIVATVVSTYGAELLRQQGGCEVLVQALDCEQLLQLIKERQIKVLLDATHPFAAAASAQACAAAQAAGIYYLRYERPGCELESTDGVYFAPDFPTAARQAARKGRVVFLTIGTRHLAECLEVLKPEACEVVARILPVEKSLQHCLSLGLLPKQIVALQGPASAELNAALFREYGADVVISKESGAAGGTPEKVAAAQDCNIPIIIVQRPEPIEEKSTPAEIVAALQKVYRNKENGR